MSPPGPLWAAALGAVSHQVPLAPKDHVSPAAPRPALVVAPASLDSQVADGAVCVTVGNPMLAAALGVTAERRGWRTRARPEPGSVLITDQVPGSAARLGGVDAVVLVVDPTPHGARVALDAVAALTVTAVVGSDDPEELDAALTCLAADRASVPRRFLDLAARMPELSGRQVRLLGAVLAGRTTAEMARSLHLSPASVKRELSAVSGLLGASSRTALFARALELGVHPTTPHA